MKKRNNLRWPALAGSLLALAFAGNAWADISISSATWQSSQRLYVLGSRAAGGATVTLKYPGDRAVIGTTTAKQSGSWTFLQSNVSPVPCHVRAESGEESSATRAVKNAPSNCSDNGGGGGGGDTTAPTAPSSLSATAASTSQINLSWTASTDNVGVPSVTRGSAPSACAVPCSTAACCARIATAA
jgi:hypothetical protein